MKIGDFSTAFLHVPIDEDTYVLAPKVLWKDGVPVYWKLNKALYGLRKAPQLFNEFLSGILERFGMTRLKGEPTVFVKDELNLLVHVDDPLAAGPEHDIESLFKYLEETMSFNRGETIGTEKWVKFLGKEYRRDAKGFVVRMPGKYYQTLISEAGLSGCKPARTAAGADKPSNLKDKETWEEALSKEEHFLFRRLVGKLRFLVPERPDLGYEVLKLSRSLATPQGKDMFGVKRVVRYVSGTTDYVLKLYPDMHKDLNLTGSVDTDYAGDRETRRSVGCTILMLDGVLIHYHSRQQTITATSSTEAEFYGIGSGLLELIFVLNMLIEMKLNPVSTLLCDSSSGRALAQKKGWGKCKHVDVKMAWVQESLTLHNIRLGAVRTEDNTADIGTKTLSQARLAMLSRRLGLEDMGGERQVLMIGLSENEELDGAGADEPESNMLFYVFLASLATNLLTIVWHCACKKRLPVVPTTRGPTTTAVGTQTTEIGVNQVMKAYVTPTGERWHIEEHCPGMNHARSKRTLDPCGHCVRGRNVNNYLL